MIDKAGKQAAGLVTPDAGQGSASAVVRARRLMSVDQHIDWTRFDRFLVWMAGDCDRLLGFAPLPLFKALLLKHWFRLRTDEFDHDMADRESFRRFVRGPNSTAPVPDHASITLFSRMIRERGLGTDLIREMESQLSGLELVPPESSLGDLMRAMGVENPFGFAAELPPDEWRVIEDAFLELWSDKRGGNPAPTLRDLSLTDLQPFERHLAVLRVVDGGRDFSYDFVGIELESANGANMKGQTLGQKAAYNVGNFGHAGLQGELQRVFQDCIAEMRPIRMTAYFRTAAGIKSQLWTIQAPVLDFATGRPAKVIAAALIRPLAIN